MFPAVANAFIGQDSVNQHDQKTSKSRVPDSDGAHWSSYISARLSRGYGFSRLTECCNLSLRGLQLGRIFQAPAPERPPLDVAQNKDIGSLGPYDDEKVLWSSTTWNALIYVVVYAGKFEPVLHPPGSPEHIRYGRIPDQRCRLRVTEGQSSCSDRYIDNHSIDYHESSIAKFPPLGGSSGIGLATTKLLLSLGCHVFSGDLSPSPVEDPAFTHVRTDVTSWKDLLALFKAATDQHARVDHVFANAGMGGRANYFESHFDANGELQEPSFLGYDVMLRGVINTIYLGLHHMRTQDPPGGSLLITASASSFQRFGAVDYATSKHGVLGFMRAIVPHLQDPATMPIRINALAPSWTLTGILPQKLVDAIGSGTQGPEAVARNVACMFVDESRNGQLVYSAKGRYFEIDEAVLLPAAKLIVGGMQEDDVIRDFLRNAPRPAVKESES
nr:3-hydroxyacyl-coa dehydrogenase type-2 [Quercus suber]